MSDLGIKINERFAEDLFPDLLDKVVEWIQEELTPEEVFSYEQLEDWAFDSGFRKFE